MARVEARSSDLSNVPPTREISAVYWDPLLFPSPCTICHLIDLVRASSLFNCGFVRRHPIRNSAEFDVGGLSVQDVQSRHERNPLQLGVPKAKPIVQQLRTDLTQQICRGCGCERYGIAANLSAAAIKARDKGRGGLSKL